VEIFAILARKNRESVFGPFLNMLNRPDTFTINQAGSKIQYIDNFFQLSCVSMKCQFNDTL
jgi:hypothetical protein